MTLTLRKTSAETTLPMWDQAPEIALAARLDALHQLLYARGGIRPVNAAIEELAKLLLMRIAAHRQPDLMVGSMHLVDLLDPESAKATDDVTPWKEAFTAVVSLPDLRGSMPGGQTQPVWPVDEPLRISRADVLAEALAVLSELSFDDNAQRSSVDPLGLAFDTLLRGKYSNSGGLGSYLTPATVARSMVDIGTALAPISGSEGLVGDPCCGTGRFLTSIVDCLRLSNPELARSVMNDRLVGADQSSSSVAMARVNLLSYGGHHPHLFTVADSITDPHVDALRGRFRLILTNPPFGDGKYDSPDGIRRTGEWLHASLRSRIDPALAFVGLCTELLEPDGVAGIVLPDGLLDSATLRSALIGTDPSLNNSVSVEGVVSLPKVAFAPAGTVAKTSILFLRKSNKRTRQSVFMARSEHVGYLYRAGNTVPDPDGDDLPEIAMQVRSIIAGSGEPARATDLVAELDIAEIRSLDASTIDIGAADARTDLLAQGGVKFTEVFKVRRKTRVGKKNPTNGPHISVLHVDELGNIDWLEAEAYTPASPGIIAHGGDLLLSLLNPSKFRAAVVPERFDTVECSPEFGVLTANIDPYAALALIQHPLFKAQIAPMGKGTSSSRRRVDAGELLNLVLPRPYQDDIGRAVQDAIESIARARRMLSGVYSCGKA